MSLLGKVTVEPPPPLPEVGVVNTMLFPPAVSVYVVFAERAVGLFPPETIERVWVWL